MLDFLKPGPLIDGLIETLRRLRQGPVTTRRVDLGHWPRMPRSCPVCGAPAKLRFTQGKGKPYHACDDHVVQALLMPPR